MRKITVNTFFYYSTPYEGNNSNRCGNQIKDEGFRSPVNAHWDLIIYKMPKGTFGGKFSNSTTEKEIYLNGETIMKIITDANAKLGNI